MFHTIISKLNWIDILLLICILRMGYVGLKRGLFIEIFKILNVLVCCFVTFHFYSSVGQLINSKLPPLPLDAAKIFSYTALCIIITLIFSIIREAIVVILRIETPTNIIKFLGAVLGVLRGVIISGLIIFGLYISTIHYLEMSARVSFLGQKVVMVPTKIYESIFRGFIYNLSQQQAFNNDVSKALQPSE